jgi:hypothetical protein
MYMWGVQKGFEVVCARRKLGDAGRDASRCGTAGRRHAGHSDDVPCGNDPREGDGIVLEIERDATGIRDRVGETGRES